MPLPAAHFVVEETTTDEPITLHGRTILTIKLESGQRMSKPVYAVEPQFLVVGADDFSDDTLHVARRAAQVVAEALSEYAEKHGLGPGAFHLWMF